MPPKLQTIFSIGRASSEWKKEDELMYRWGSNTDDLGAFQGSPAMAHEDPKKPPLPRSVAIKPVAPELTAAGQPTLRTRQLWEGTVTEVRDGHFLATLNDRTNPQNPDEQALFDVYEVPQDDHSFIKVGSSFYWTIGTERTPAGQVKNISAINFRRIPAWTRSAVTKVSALANHLDDVFQSAL